MFACLVLGLFTFNVSAKNRPLHLKVIQAPSFNFFYGQYQLSNDNLHQQGEKLAETIAYAVATKTHGVIQGAFTYRFRHVQTLAPQNLIAEIGWPVNKPVTPIAAYHFEKVPSMRSVTYRYEGMNKGMLQAWKILISQAQSQGFKPTGEGRTIIQLSSNTGYVVADLQLGVE
jgi:hypothetical protein